ncbi:Signal transduction histidine kinase [Raineyella antarctica]|uniref:histidine kinase n=1 Tax=Raineyella antarctica TaxID=1577474 RepID=A0A1G6GCW2_9ACTN|nr:ATP-binding protein [Raineyella antarctica]SDB79828.1 Signal transduction histidine kinase [Raineyella antarctica]
MPAHRHLPPAPRATEGILGIRSQAALVAMLVIAFTLFTGGVVMILVLGSALRGGVEESLRSRAAEASAIVAAEGPGALGAVEARHLIASGPLQLVEHGPADAGKVVYTSSVIWDTPVTALNPEPGQVLVDPHATSPHTGDPIMVVTHGVQVGNHDYDVVVAGSLVSVERALRQDAISLLVGVPLLSLLGGLAVWLVVGRTLRPVEQIRTAVEEISVADLHRRVPVPPGRDEVGRLATTMNAMLDRIQHAQDSQRRFVADASHELRSPVAALGAGLEILAERPEESGAVVPLLKTETRHLASLTEGLLLLARADAGTLRGRRIDVDMDDIVGAEVVRLRTAGRLKVEAHLEAARLVGDPDELHRVVRNLVDNASRFARSRLGLTVVHEDGQVVVRIDDDGPGIPADERARVFERFVRLDPARGRSHGGAGLGLSIVSSIVAAHGGTVEAGESPWGGTRISIRLPGTDAVTPDPEDS